MKKNEEIYKITIFKRSFAKFIDSVIDSTTSGPLGVLSLKSKPKHTRERLLPKKFVYYMDIR